MLQLSLTALKLRFSPQTTTILDTFFLAMTLNPAIQKEAQIAVDRVCSDRLPEFSDYDDIPYVHAVVMECLRWRPALPLGKLTKSSMSFFY